MLKTVKLNPRVHDAFIIYIPINSSKIYCDGQNYEMVISEKEINSLGSNSSVDYYKCETKKKI